jgi:hypothetical protein
VSQDGLVEVNLTDGFLKTAAASYKEKRLLPFLLTSEAAFALDGLLATWRREKLHDGLSRNVRHIAAKIGLLCDEAHRFRTEFRQVMNQVKQHRTLWGGRQIGWSINGDIVTFKPERKKPQPVQRESRRDDEDDDRYVA